MRRDWPVRRLVDTMGATMSFAQTLGDADLEAGLPGDAGLFGPQSLVWRLGRERLLLLGGPAAVLLQLAHPLVAAGVAEHSGFQDDPVRRLRSTLAATLTVTFGDTGQVDRVSAAVGRRHLAVAGRLPTPVGRFAAGTPYSATDPELLLWVHATLVYTAIEVFDRFVHRMPRHDRARYYTEIKPYAYVFGVPEGILPADYGAFEGYVEHVVDKDLAVGDTARSLAIEVLEGGFPAPPPVRFFRDAITAALLPRQVRDGYQLPYGPEQAAAVAALQRGIPPIAAVLPGRIRYWPHYATARRRVMRTANGTWQ